jgi:hypothetical protein
MNKIDNFDVEYHSQREYTRYIFQFLREESATPIFFSVLLKTTERQGFGLYSRHQAL